MAWIEFHGAKIKRLKKFGDMKRLLNWSTNEALGFLGSFWGEVIELAEDGDISKWSPEYICELTDTKLNPIRVWETLMRTEWIDMTEDGLYIVHDWLDTAGRYLELKYRTSNPEKLEQIKAKHKKPVIRLTKNSPPNLTRPNQTKPKSGERKSVSPTGEIRGYFYEQYKNKFGREYVADFGKDGKIFQELLKTIEINRLMELINSFFGSQDEFIAKAGHTIGVFKSQVNKLQIPKNNDINLDKVRRDREESDKILAAYREGHHRQGTSTPVQPSR